MGLDMYLKKKKYIGKAKIKILENEYDWYENISKEYSNVKLITSEVGYWRKANQIHKWFVDNCQGGNDDCREYYVSKEKLKELLERCKRIKNECKLIDGKIINGQPLENGKWINNYEDGKVMTNIEVAEELLPTQSGFFFGGTDYDEYYMQDIDNTIEIIEKVLEEDDDIYYQSSW